MILLLAVNIVHNIPRTARGGSHCHRLRLIIENTVYISTGKNTIQKSTAGRSVPPQPRRMYKYHFVSECFDIDSIVEDMDG